MICFQDTLSWSKTEIHRVRTIPTICGCLGLTFSESIDDAEDLGAQCPPMQAHTTFAIGIEITEDDLVACGTLAEISK
jgi:hypothetical protein